MIIYDIALCLLSVAVAPKLLYEKIRYGKYPDFLKKKCATHFPVIEKGSRPLFWIHAVSVGETRAVSALAKKLKALPSNPLLLITNVTDTGHQEALKTLPFADYHLFLPFDFLWIMRPLMKRIKPDLILITETDLWYNLMNEAKSQGARIALVNGKISEQSAKRLSWFPYFTKRLLGFFDLFALQNQEYFDRFAALGVPASKMHVTGNLKLDVPPPKNQTGLAEQLHLSKDDVVIVAGSTHEGEECIILNAYCALKPSLKRKLILVPRHPERFNHVADLIQKTGKPWGRYSQGFSGGEEILLIDAMGLLNACYNLSTLSLVAGSFVPGIGGHNIFEPAAFGKPVLFGAFMEGQKDFVRLMLSAVAAEQVPVNQLKEYLERFLANPQKCLDMGLRGNNLYLAQQGASEKTYDLLFPIAVNSPAS